MACAITLIGKDPTMHKDLRKSKTQGDLNAVSFSQGAEEIRSKRGEAKKDKKIKSEVF